MANPAPIITSIAAFDATQGTTMYYNTIGATEIIKSSRVRIYKVSDNSSQLVYLYTGTMQSDGQYQLVIPALATTGVLANGTQYYATIETYTSTDGVTGASGESVAKIFYCLATPTLTAPTMPNPVSTSTYNPTFTYSYTGSVDNKIKQYEIALYEAGSTTATETSGVVVGNGTQTGTNTYTVSYNLSSLVSGTSYKIKCTVETMQGTIITAETSTFLCTISSPSFSAATVVNNYCGGYITIGSEITNIEGICYDSTGSQVTPSYAETGGVLLATGQWIDWSTGFRMVGSNDLNNWTLHMWCSNLETSSAFAHSLALIYLGAYDDDDEVTGQIGVFVTENSAGTQIRLECLMDIDGDGGNIATYHSDYMDIPDTDDNLYVQIRCIDNWIQMTFENFDAS